MGAGWFERPTVFVCMRLVDDGVPRAVDRLKRLGTVREVHLNSRRLTERGASDLRSGLPGVGVATSNDPAMKPYWHSQVDHEHFAAGGALIAAGMAVGLLSTVVAVAWTLVRRRRSRRAVA